MKVCLCTGLWEADCWERIRDRRVVPCETCDQLLGVTADRGGRTERPPPSCDLPSGRPRPRLAFLA